MLYICQYSAVILAKVDVHLLELAIDYGLNTIDYCLLNLQNIAVYRHIP